MTESICLTVYFDGSFWLGRWEWREAKCMRVATYTFGQEPTNPQLLAKLPHIWQDLTWSPAVDQEKLKPHKRLNPKRLLRQAKRALVEAPVASSKAQLALKVQQETRQQKGQRQKSAHKRERQARQFALKQAKRREKHRGH